MSDYHYESCATDCEVRMAKLEDELSEAKRKLEIYERTLIWMRDQDPPFIQYSATLGQYQALAQIALTGFLPAGVR